MDPIANQQFSHDFQKFVLQDPNVRIIEQKVPPKPFDVDTLGKVKKNKKDLEKEKKNEKKETDNIL